MNVLYVLELFLTEQKRRNNSGATLTFYDENIRYFASYINKNIDLYTIDDIFIFLDMLRKKGNSSNGINTRYRSLRAFFRWASEQGYCSNIFEGVKTPKGTRKAISILTNDEIRTLLSCVAGRNRLIVLLMLDCGLRRSEVCSLRCEDIFDNYFIVRGKGDKERIVPMSDYIKLPVQEQLIKSRLQNQGVLIDVSENAIKLLFQKLKKITGIKRLHAHLLRHTFATLYLVNGGDPISLQHILGHESLEITKVYLHLAQTYVFRAGNKYSPMMHLDEKK